MYFYAQLNDENICIGVSALKEEIVGADMVEIESLDYDCLWRKYENGEWSEEKYEPEPVEPEETIEEKLNRMEQDFQETKLIQYDVLATIFEEILLLHDRLDGGE